MGPMFDGTRHNGSLWRDYNDHIFRVDEVTQDETGWFTLVGTILYCTCGIGHKDQPYTTYAEPDDDLDGGEIFGFSRMWP